MNTIEHRMLIFDFIANVLFPIGGTVYLKTFRSVKDTSDCIFNASGLHLIHKHNIKFYNDFLRMYCLVFNQPSLFL